MWHFTLNFLAVFVCLYSRIVCDFIIRDSVIFHKNNEVSSTRAKWLATLVIDFDSFEHFMSLVATDIKCAEITLGTILSEHIKTNKELKTFRNIFMGLQRETAFLSKLKDKIGEEVQQLLKHLGNSTSSRRTKRSLLPFIGQGLSWLCGVISERDLDHIKKSGICSCKKSKTNNSRSRKKYICN